MNLKAKIKLWFLFAQDSITLIFVFVIFFLFFCLLNYCDAIEPTYDEYTKKAEIINIIYEYSYTHSGWDDAVPKINGVRYSLFYKVNGIETKCNIFVKHYDKRVNENIDLRNFDLLEIKYSPKNVSSAMIFLR